MKYSTGSMFNFSVAAGIAEVIKIQVGFAGELDGLNVSDATFRFGYRTEGGDIAYATVEHGEEAGSLYLHLPSVGSGEYQYVLEYVDSLGRNGVLLCGIMTAISRAVADAISEEANAAEVRVLEVTAGGLHGGPLELRWCASSVAAKYAEDARAAADKAEAAAGLAGGVSEDVLATLKQAQAFMNSFNEALLNSISVVNNRLYIGGKDTGIDLKGADGITPHIGLDGYWYAGTKKLGDKPAFGKDGITPHITPDGFWAFGDYKSETLAEGRDGLDGSAVRMILVDSYEDIPQSGDTCNGGFRYLVKKEGWALIGNEYAARAVEWSAWEVPGDELPDYFNTIKVEEALNTNTTPVYLLVRTASGDVLGISRNANTWTPGDTVVWDFDEDVVIPHGKKIRLILRISNTAITGPIYDDKIKMHSRCGDGDSRWLFDNLWYGGGSPYLFAYGRGSGLNYDVYTWVETQGSASWVKIDRTDQIANSRVYGLMKYATETTVEGGAPVGQNADGQASVPIANAALPGAVLPSSTATESDGGRTHVGADNKLYVGYANPSIPGVGKTSYTREVEDTGTVGMTADGKFAVPRADARQWGCCRIGTVVRQTNGAPYIIPIGRAADGLTERPNGGGGDISGQLMMNTLYGGAIRTYGKSEWESWLPQGLNYDLIYDNSNAVGLVTSVQFQQTAAVGLELLAATTDTLAGVYIARDQNDDRPAAVVAASTLRNVETEIREWVEDNFCKQDKVVTDTTLAQSLSSYLTKSNAASTYVRKPDFDELSKNVMLKSEFMPCKMVTEEEYNALGDKLDDNVAYIIV